MTKNNRYQVAKAAGGLDPKSLDPLTSCGAMGFRQRGCEAGAQVGVWAAMDVFSVWAADGRGWQGLHRLRFGISLFAGCRHRLRALVVPGASGLRSTPMIGLVKRGRPRRPRSSATSAATPTRWTRRPASCCGRRASIPIRSHASPRASRSMTDAFTSPSPRSKNPSRRVSTTCAARSGPGCRAGRIDGKQIWKTYTIPEEPSERKTDQGVKFLGPSGAGIWGPITIDPKRQAVYVSTGNAVLRARPRPIQRSDGHGHQHRKGSVVTQAMHGDVWHTGCPQGPSSVGHPPRSAHRRPWSTAAGARGTSARPTCRLLLSRRKGESRLGFLRRDDPGRPTRRRVARPCRPEIGRRVGSRSRQQRARWSEYRISAADRFSSAVQRTTSRRTSRCEAPTEDWWRSG